MITKYIQLEPESLLPNIDASDIFRCVVIAEEHVSDAWCENVSQWLVEAGCLYMLAWGINSSFWDISIDLANIAAFDFENIPEESLVMTTWHEHQTLEEVLEFCKLHAFHPTREFVYTLLLHISIDKKEQDILDIYERA